MVPRILITGRGTSGSWQIRGVQLGAAIGATVRADADAATIAAHDIIVIVKRGSDELVQRIHTARKPLVWDVVDSWPQPDGNLWAYRACMEWLRNRLRRNRPVACIAATRRMEADLEDCRVPALWVPHHARPAQPLNPIRPHLRVIGYEGSEAHLGRWAQVLRTIAAIRGMQFVLQPQRLADVDVVVALREHHGYGPTCWKSNVKLANAQATGTPCILDQEDGYRDTAMGGECWRELAGGQEHLASLIDGMRPQEVRAAAAARLVTGTITLERCAVAYRDFITACALKFS